MEPQDTDPSSGLPPDKVLVKAVLVWTHHIMATANTSPLTVIMDQYSSMPPGQANKTANGLVPHHCLLGMKSYSQMTLEESMVFWNWSNWVADQTDLKVLCRSTCLWRYQRYSLWQHVSVSDNALRVFDTLLCARAVQDEPWIKAAHNSNRALVLFLETECQLPVVEECLHN